MQSAGGRNPGIRGETGGIGDQTEMSGNGMEKLSREQNLKTAARELERWEEAEDIIKFIIRC